VKKEPAKAMIISPKQEKKEPEEPPSKSGSRPPTPRSGAKASAPTSPKAVSPPATPTTPVAVATPSPAAAPAAEYAFRALKTGNSCQIANSEALAPTVLDNDMEENIVVAVRVRPMAQDEKGREVWRLEPGNVIACVDEMSNSNRSVSYSFGRLVRLKS
jgi:hypothetical protein